MAGGRRLRSADQRLQGDDRDNDRMSPGLSGRGSRGKLDGAGERGKPDKQWGKKDLRELNMSG
jgi:hypothetical protein